MRNYDKTDSINRLYDHQFALTMDEFYYHYDTLKRLLSFPYSQAIYVQVKICLDRCKMLYDRAMQTANTPEQKQAAYDAYQDCIKQCGLRSFR